jgi:hypothetical protein
MSLLGAGARRSMAPMVADGMAKRPACRGGLIVLAQRSGSIMLAQGTAH